MSLGPIKKPSIGHSMRTRFTPYAKQYLDKNNKNDLLLTQIFKEIETNNKMKVKELLVQKNTKILLEKIFEEIMVNEPQWNKPDKKPEILIYLFRTIFSDFNPILEEFLKNTKAPTSILDQTEDGICSIQDLDTTHLNEKHFKNIKCKTSKQCMTHNKKDDKKLIDSFFCGNGNKLCYLCGGTISDSNSEECDHVFPVLDMFTKLEWNNNTISNFLSTHKSCNTKAKNKDIKTLFATIGNPNEFLLMGSNNFYSTNTSINMNKCKFYLLYLVINKINFVNLIEYEERVRTLYDFQLSVLDSKKVLEDYIRSKINKRKVTAERTLKALKELTYDDSEEKKIKTALLQMDTQAQGKTLKKNKKKRRTKIGKKLRKIKRKIYNNLRTLKLKYYKNNRSKKLKKVKNKKKS